MMSLYVTETCPDTSTPPEYAKSSAAPISSAEYSDSNGGRTVAGSYPYLRSVSDPDDAAAPLHHWHYSVPLSALAGCPRFRVGTRAAVKRPVRDADMGH